MGRLGGSGTHVGQTVQQGNRLKCISTRLLSHKQGKSLHING